MSDQSQKNTRADQLARYDDDTIDLMEIFLLLWEKKVAIITTSLICGLFAGIIAFILPPRYEINTLLQVIKREQESSASSLAGKFGGVAALAGLNIGGSGDESAVAMATLKSRHLISAFIQEENLLPILFYRDWDKDKKVWKVKGDDIPTLWDGHKYFEEKVMSLSQDPDSGLVILSITWIDTTIALDWNKKLIARANIYLQKKAKEDAEKNLIFLQQQMGLIQVTEIRNSLSEMVTTEMKRKMMANVSDDYAFKVVDPALEPNKDEFIFPNRLLFIAIGIFLGGIFGVLYVLINEKRKNLKILK